jgi:hypothetical protein
MFDDEKNSERMKMASMGQRIRAGHAQAEPIGDKMINVVRGAIWEAWEKGLDNSGHIYPAIPLLDQPTQRDEQTEDIKPGLFSRHVCITKRFQHPALDEPNEPEP